MMGRRAGYLTSQGLLVANWLARNGEYAVTTTSAVTNRYLRLLDIVATLIRSRNDVDVQCLEVYGGPSFVVEDLASFIGRACGHRVVMVLHGGALPEFIDRHPRWTRRVLNRADALVAPSTYLQRAVGRSGLQARVIPNVLDLEAYPFRPRRHIRPHLFWMRSFHPIWNPEMAVRVLARVKRRFPEATLTMAGQDKGMLGGVQRLAAERGVLGSVRFPGFLDSEGKRREAAAADIFLNTNRIDNMPVAVVEACAMGLPVVSTKVGGISDLLVHGETGLLVLDDDDEAMADAVIELVGDDALVERLSAGGRRLAERSDWKAVRPQWDLLIAELHSSSPASTAYPQVT